MNGNGKLMRKIRLEAFNRKKMYNLPQPWAVGFEVGAEFGYGFAENEKEELRNEREEWLSQQHESLEIIEELRKEVERLELLRTTDYHELTALRAIADELYQALKVWVPMDQEPITGDSFLDRSLKALRGYENTIKK